MLRSQSLEERHGIDKFTLNVQFFRPPPSGIFLGSCLWCLGSLPDATGGDSDEEKRNHKRLDQVVKCATHDGIPRLRQFRHGMTE